ncbi:phosphopantetheine-binding protein [Streptomyces sp. NPDC047860]|uniref:phosphopantetheine-binding protein n=1 Tax=Streptomyces sp. NPDC047860 TaxID=3155743 RepID=UPI0033D6F4D3
MPIQQTGSDEEHVLAAVTQAWHAALGCEGIGPADNFFSLGGNSLMALRIANQISTDLGVMPPLRLLFEHSDFGDYVREIGELLMSHRAEQGAGR